MGGEEGTHKVLAWLDRENNTVAGEAKFVDGELFCKLFWTTHYGQQSLAKLLFHTFNKLVNWD